MEYVYVIGGLIVWFAIYSVLNKFYLDRTFKKFDLGNDSWCFKPSLQRILLFYVFPYALFIAGFSYYVFSRNKLDFYQLLFIFIILPVVAYIYISKPLKAIKAGFQITLNGNIAEFKGKKDIRIDLSQCVSIFEKRQIASRSTETYVFKGNGKELTIDFNDFVLGVYSERVVELMKTKTKSGD